MTNTIIGQYIEDLARFCDANEWERLEKLLEVAYRFDEVATGVRTQQFIDMLEDERVSNYSAAHIQVMTIHAANGISANVS